jgi:Mor family transcriptional regulator
MSWSESATPLLVEMADHAARVLHERFGMDEDIADHAGFEIVRAWAEAVGGASVYIPTAESIRRHERDEAIWREFNGRNQIELARRYKITEIHVYRIIKRMRAQDVATRQSTLAL